ncbi:MULTISPECIES: cyclic nucleotide-binding domain-containing protein [Serratia]|uniref:cyclic nucleotide-binding domain-containing protein n=1 Tax=Serratia TaxID=613 RepID=UPI002179581F|nr:MULTISPECIES: cyclic nucleotide-binding domain-containing protein [Serratia]CAI1001802.1 Uncharacterised protein [Serratia quinivorans]CAI1087716.1 Uncharacterised protein [Serratia quinivorans]CAI2122105.1 Uncharacterised protein [Serratia quinivorans]CAI2489133.1 Uncharacterised protein [Serratia liquefaciens]
MSTAPPDAKPRLIHIALPGRWAGEDSFLTGQPRRIELVAQSESWAMHVPLATMEQMAQANPENIRSFGVISVMSVDSLLRIVHDLQKKKCQCKDRCRTASYVPGSPFTGPSFTRESQHHRKYPPQTG